MITKIYKQFQRKIFLGVFKLRRIVNSFLSIKRLDYTSKNILLHIDNIREYETRANSCGKEPETVKWIEHFSLGGNIFYDIGANIGAYSLVAAANDMQVYAFEPSYPNFYTLNRNISLNKFDGKVESFPIILSTDTKVDTFKYFETTSGTARCYYNREDKIHGNKTEAKRATLVYSLDNFIRTFDLPRPNMMKIDVDGGEYEVLQGAEDTLVHPDLKTVLIEIDDTLGGGDKIIKYLESKGFIISEEHPFNDVIKNVIFVKK